MLKSVFKFCALVLTLNVLTACTQIMLSQKDKLELQSLRDDYLKEDSEKSEPKKEDYTNSEEGIFLQNILFQDPAQLAV